MDRFTVETSWSPEQIEAELRRRATELPRSGDGYDFVGTVAVDRFKLMRKLWYRNVCRPFLRGTVTRAPFGAIVVVRMRMVAAVLAVLILLSLFAPLALAGGLGALARGRWDKAGVPLFYAAFYSGIWWVAIYELREAERFFRALLPPRNTPSP